MKPYLLVVGVLGAFTAGLLVGSNAQPILVGGGGTPANSIQFPATAPRAAISAPSGALTIASGGTNQNVILTPSGTGLVSTAANVAIGAPFDTTAPLSVQAASSSAGMGLRIFGRASDNNGRVEFFQNGSTTLEGAIIGQPSLLILADSGGLAALAIKNARLTGCGGNTSPAQAMDCTGNINASGVFMKGGTSGVGSNTLFTVCTSGACITSCTLQFNGGIRVGGTCP